MPRFFFHLRNDVSVDDQEGYVLADLGAARLRAEAFARDMIASTVIEQGKINLQHRIEVADETGRIVSVVPFGAVLRFEDSAPADP